MKIRRTKMEMQKSKTCNPFLDKAGLSIVIFLCLFCQPSFCQVRDSVVALRSTEPLRKGFAIIPIYTPSTKLIHPVDDLEIFSNESEYTIYSMFHGKVIRARKEDELGYVIAIKNNKYSVAFFAPADKILVSEDASIKKGTALFTVKGSSNRVSVLVYKRNKRLPVLSMLKLLNGQW